MEAGRRHGFGVTLIDPLRDEGAEIISSSRIRALLGEGRLGEANALLGYRHVVEAEVVPGKRLGRSLGYPTANMALGEEAALAPGIYAVRFRRADGRLMDGVASFGRRPTVEEAGAMLLETFIFDFSSDLYGETCRVFLFAFLRGEKKFPDIDALVARMQQDEMEARRHLAGVMPLSALDALLAFS
jgi:riboflavin kinase/FMN adenylyltransferase